MKTNPNAVKIADRTDVTIVATGPRAKCLLQFAPNAEPKPKCRLSLLKADRYSVWNASRGKNRQLYKEALKPGFWPGFCIFRIPLANLNLVQNLIQNEYNKITAGKEVVGCEWRLEAKISKSLIH